MFAELFKDLFSKDADQKDASPETKEPLLGGFFGTLAALLVEVASLLPGGQIISPRDNDELNNSIPSQINTSSEKDLSAQKSTAEIPITEKNLDIKRAGDNRTIENVVESSPDIKEILAGVVAGLREVSHADIGAITPPTAIAAPNTAREAQSGRG